MLASWLWLAPCLYREGAFGLLRLRVFFGPLLCESVRFLDLDFDDDADLVIELFLRFGFFDFSDGFCFLIESSIEQLLERLVGEIDRDPWLWLARLSLGWWAASRDWDREIDRCRLRSLRSLRSSSSRRVPATDCLCCYRMNCCT